MPGPESPPRQAAPALGLAALGTPFCSLATDTGMGDALAVMMLPVN
ncbi:hypothetical protein ACWD6K_13005 [Streptomyces sp. NPDC002431]